MPRHARRVAEDDAALPLVPLPADRWLGRAAAAEDGAVPARARLRARGRDRAAVRPPTAGRRRTRRCWPSCPSGSTIGRVAACRASGDAARAGAAAQSAGSASGRRGAQWWIEGSTELGVEAGPASDLIYVWMQPYDSAEAGASLSRTLGKPWVADLGDPWALDEMMVYPTALHRRARAAADAAAPRHGCGDRHEHARRRFAACLREFPELARRPGGRDSERLRRCRLRGEPPAARRTAPFRIVHTGYLHTELGLEHRAAIAAPEARWAGASRGLDILTRSHVYLVEAINRLLARDPGLEETFELHLAGVLTDADREVAARCPVVAASRLRHPRRVDRSDAERPTSSSSRCRICRRACARRSSRARRTSTSPPARRSSRRFLTVMPATSSMRRATRACAGQTT